MSFIKKIIGYIPIVLVMLISIAAFVPSFFSDNLSDALEDDNERLNELQLTYNWMSIQADNIYKYDSNIYTLMWEELDACKEIDTEWITLGSNATLLQNLTFVNKIFMHLGRVSVLADQTYSFAIHTFFNLSPTEERFIFGVSSTNIPYSIERTKWEEKPVYLQTTQQDFLMNIYSEWYTEPGNYFFFNDTMQFLINNYAADITTQLNFLWADDTLYTLDQRTNIYNLTHTPLLILEREIEDVKFRILDGEALTGNYQTVVSIMTVATLLATAISGRLEERKITHQLSKLRADIQDKPDIVIPEIDRFSIILLAIAVAIAITGLILVYWV